MKDKNPGLGIRQTRSVLPCTPDQLCDLDTEHSLFCEMGSLSRRGFKIIPANISNLLHTDGHVQ